MLETFLINTNFVLLLTTTILYWISAIFLRNFSFLSAAVLCSQVFQMTFLIVRWFSSNHFPLTNLYESLLFLSWVLTFLLSFFNTKSLKTQPTMFNTNFLIGSIMMPIILLVNTFALFSLPDELKLSSSLVPALQSNWLVMHVTVMILSYGALICGCLLSMAYLVLTFFNPKFQFKSWASEGSSLISQQTSKFNVNNVELFSNQTLSSIPQVSSIQNFNQNLNNSLIIKDFTDLIKSLDNLSYRILSLGFFLLTIGLLSGSIWANQTWGSYWSWDPKETWALITWFIFAIYLHTRFSKQWTGRKSAILATFGFFILWICYLGVNLMGKGLHSYGFLS